MTQKPNKKLTNKAPEVQKPLREPDHISKRGVHYYWSPEWIRGTDYSNTKFGRIKALKENNTVNLYMLSKEGTLSFIQGSIQKEFKEWHLQRKIDYFFPADDPEALDEMILAGEM